MMFASQVTSRFESQFFLNALIPTAVFLPIAAGILGHSIWGLPYLFDHYSALQTPARLAILLIGLAGIWLVASIVASQWSNIVRVFEGYPLISLFYWTSQWHYLSWIGRKMAIPSLRAHYDRRERVRDRTETGSLPDTELDLSYDIGDYLLPTRLGNILHAAEMYPFRRYGIDVIVFWTRLAMLIPQDVLRDIESLINRYQLPLVISAWAALISLTGIVAAIRGDLLLFTLSLGLGAAITYLGYHMSLRSAREYGVALRAAFDVYRTRLVESWPPIEEVEGERSRFYRLREFVVWGDITKVPVLRGNGDTARDITDWDDSLLQDVLAESGRRIRASLLAGYILIFWWLIGLFSMLPTTQYLVATAYASPYTALTEISGTKYLPRNRVPARDRDNVLATKLRDSKLVAIQKVKPGTVLTKANTVQAEYIPARLLQIIIGSTEANQLGVESGKLIKVVLSQQTESDRERACREGHAKEVSRIVDGQVMSVEATNSTQLTLTVAVDPSAAMSMACYGSDRASVSLNIK